MATNIFSLMKERAFLPFFITQFLGAFNDNVFKLAMLTLISYHLTHTQDQSEYYQALAGALFIAPFFFFSATAGELADKYDKTIMIRLIKIFEILLMIAGSFALYWGAISGMLLTLAGLGVHSAFFGPLKYSILPDHLSQERLLGATGLVDASTFMAILLGNTLGTLSIDVHHASPYVAVFFTIAIACCGFLASLFIPRSSLPSSDSPIHVTFWYATYDKLKLVMRYRSILMPIMILSWFWLLGSVVLIKLPDYTNYVLGADNRVFALFLALFSIGVACGSLCVNLFFKGRVVLAIVPWAMLAVSCFMFDLYWVSEYNTHDTLLTINNFFVTWRHWRIALDLFLLAVCSGLFVVPLYTYLQIVSPAEIRGQVFAANNIYNALFMVLGSVMVMVLLHFDAQIPQVFLVLSGANAVFVLFHFSQSRAGRKSV